MMERVVLSLMLLLTGVGVVFAQDGEVLATGLNNPRNLFFDVDGTLYIAEAGTAGKDTVANPSGFGDVPLGYTAQITTVSPDGKQSVFMAEFQSLELSHGQIVGLHAVHLTPENMYIAFGQGRTPGGPTSPQDLPMNGIAVVNRTDLYVNNYIDLFSYEEDNNPDEGEELGSNPMDFAFSSDDSIMYVADASANAVLKWTEEEGLSTFVVWKVEADTSPSVPTTVAVASNGDVYVGFLTGYPFAPKTSRIEHYNAEGELLTAYDGLSFVTDILLASDGSLYAVEMATGYKDDEEFDFGFLPNTGRVVKVTEDEIIPMVTALNYPYGIAQKPSGEIYVTVNSFFSEVNSGEVVRINTDQ